MTRPVLLISTVLFAMAPVLDLFAQYSSQDGIQGTGNVVLERPAERMRMQIEMLAKSSKDLPDAIARLKSQRANVEKQLATLGAIKDSIKFGDPRIDESQDDNQRQVEMMMRQRISQPRGKRPVKEVLSKPVRVAMKLTAEWSLKPGDAVNQLVESRKLQDAVKAADLSGQKAADDPTAEESELAEEMEGAANFGGGNGRKPGEPMFLFLALIPAADREKGLADAFQNAKAEAVKLAKAAEIELGALRSLQSTGSVDTDDSESYQQLYNSGYGHMMRHQLTGASDTGEALGVSPGVLKFRVGVSATFAIKTGHE